MNQHDRRKRKKRYIDTEADETQVQNIREMRPKKVKEFNKIKTDSQSKTQNKVHNNRVGTRKQDRTHDN